MNAPVKAPVVYEGVVTHARLKPVQHKLKYKVFSFLLDLDSLDTVAARLKFFSRNRFNLFSVRDRDHGVKNRRTWPRIFAVRWRRLMSTPTGAY